MLRIANKNDIEPLTELIKESARGLSKHDYTTKQIETAIHYIFGVDTDLLEDQTYYVIEEHGIYLACGGWSKRKTLCGGNQYDGREAGFLNPQTDAAKIRAFFVNPKHARQGLGSRLLKYCEQQAQVYGFSRVEMMATLPGVKLYKTFGYTQVEKKDLLFPNGVSLNFIHMNKNLTD
jgi:N-acetylglutamate synthase-like GNAT family acetyltransferase